MLQNKYFLKINTWILFNLNILEHRHDKKIPVPSDILCRIIRSCDVVRYLSVRCCRFDQRGLSHSLIFLCCQSKIVLVILFLFSVGIHQLFSVTVFHYSFYGRNHTKLVVSTLYRKLLFL